MIKKISISMLLLVIMSITTFGQIEKRELYQHKVESYKSLRTTGFILVGSGIAVGVLGGVLISNAEWETESTSTSTQATTTDPSAMVGVLAVFVGTAASITGTVLASVGSRKVRDYQRRLDRLDIGINYKPHNKGLVFSYRF